MRFVSSVFFVCLASSLSLADHVGPLAPLLLGAVPETTTAAEVPAALTLDKFDKSLRQIYSLETKYRDLLDKNKVLKDEVQNLRETFLTAKPALHKFTFRCIQKVTLFSAEGPKYIPQAKDVPTATSFKATLRLHRPADGKSKIELIRSGVQEELVASFENEREEAKVDLDNDQVPGSKGIGVASVSPVPNFSDYVDKEGRRNQSYAFTYIGEHGNMAFHASFDDIKPMAPAPIRLEENQAEFYRTEIHCK